MLNVSILSAMQFVFAHALERCTQEIENLYSRHYMTSGDYKQLVKEYGKAVADEVVTNTSRRVLRQQDVMDLNNIMRKAKEMHTAMEKATNIGIKVCETDEMTAFDSLQLDANDMCRMYLLMANAKQDAKTNKEIEAYIGKKKDKNKQYADDDLINRFKVC